MASSSPHTLYYERLSPGPGMWFLTLCAGGASYLVGAPIGIPVGIIAAVVVTLLLGWILYFSAHHRQTMIDIHPQKIKQPQGLRLPIHQRHIINAEGILQRRVLI